MAHDSDSKGEQILRFGDTCLFLNDGLHTRGFIMCDSYIEDRVKLLKTDNKPFHIKHTLFRICPLEQYTGKR
jgi:hypothetical protein